MDNTTFESSSVNSALTRIKNTLNYSLKENYGIEDPEITEKFLHLHGLDKSRFDFINNFETLIEKGIADESVDTNANKSDKSITGFFVEASLPIKKLVGYRYLYRKLKELYGKKEAKRLSGEMYDMSLALADSTNILSPYSYYGNTPIYIKINNEEYYMTLKQLFERFQKYSQYDEEYDMDVIYTDDIKQDVLFHKSFMMNNENRGRNAAYTKSTKDLEKLNENILCLEDVDIKVWDDENGFVNISRIVRHKNDKDMIIYATEDGDFAFVTPDHPVILEDNSEVTAENLTTGMKIKDAQMSNPVPSRANTVYVPEKFAYFLGFILGDGNLQGYDQDPDYIDNPVGCVKFVRGGNLVSIYQKDIENSKIYSIAKELFPDAKFFKYHNDDAINPMTGKPFSNNDRKINFTSWALNSLCSYYFEYGRRENSFTKKLPKNIFNWKRESIEVFIAGLLDADGIVHKSNGACEISMKSVASINGIYELLSMLGTKAHKKLRGCNNDDIMFSVSFRPTEKIYEWSEKLGQVEFNKVFDDYESKYDTRPRSNKISKIIKISKKNENVKYKDSAFYDELEYVYDITTDTGRFVANGMVQHNCFSINASKLVMEGRPFGSLPSGVPHRVISYINALCETIHQLSNHLAGAIAAGSLFLDIAHVLIYREHKTLADLKNPEYRKYIGNSLQAFVHSVNMLSRNAVESPFTNVSVFDRMKLKALIDDDNMGWYFDKEDVLDGAPDSALADCGDRDWHDYICDVILELEDIFMDVMDNGDPLHDHRVIEFPVVTFNISRKKNDDATYAFEDPEWVKSFCEKHDIYRYNIYVSEGMKVASCCFAPNTPLTFINSDGEVSTMSIGDYVETRLDEELGNKDYVQKTLPGDEFINTRHGQIIPITGVIKLQNKWKRLIKITFTTGDEIWCTPDQKFLLLNEELAEAKDLTEGSLLYRYLEVKSVDSYESDEPVYDIEVGSEDHIFKIKLPSGHSTRVHNCFLGDQYFAYVGEDGKIVYESFNTFVSRYLDKDLGEKRLSKEEQLYSVIDPNTDELVPITGVLRKENEYKEIIEIELEDGTIISATPDQGIFDKVSGKLVTAKEIAEHPDKYEI